MNDCRTVLAQVKAMKGAYEANKRANYGNKTWTRSNNTTNTTSKSNSGAMVPTHQQKSKEQLHALMEARIEKEIEARIKKRTEEALYEFEHMSLSDDDIDDNEKKKKE